LNKRFAVSVPESIDVSIKDMSGNEQTAKVIWQNSLLQAMDLIHNHVLWGNESNFIDMDDPFDSFKYGQSDNKVDEVIDGVWYKNVRR